MMQKKLKILWTFLAVLIMATANSQTTLQVATKHLEKEFNGIQTVIIDAEKAEIEILVWNKNKVLLSMDLSAKHPEKSVSAKDLSYLKFANDVKNGTLLLRNYILLGQKDQKPESNFKTKYILKIPENTVLEIKNSFGKIAVSGETQKLNITSEFCVLTLNHIAGNSKIQTKYGEINIDAINGNTVIKTERSNLNMKNFSSKFNITSFYGEILFSQPKELQNLSLQADKSEVKLRAIPAKKYEINLSTSFGKINIPSDMGQVISSKNGEKLINNAYGKSKIRITNKSGNITLEKL